MSEQMWAFLGIEVTTLGTVTAAWLQVRKPVRKLGNGFSERVESELKQIKALATEARNEIREHKNVHVEASLRGKS
jgi:hypothetical protein